MIPEISNPPTPEQLKQLGFGPLSRLGLYVLDGMVDVATTYSSKIPPDSIDVMYPSTIAATKRAGVMATRKTIVYKNLQFSPDSIFPGVS